MKTFSNMSTPIMVITDEAYELLFKKLMKRKGELDNTISTLKGHQVDVTEMRKEVREIEDKLNILGPLLVELALLII